MPCANSLRDNAVRNVRGGRVGWMCEEEGSQPDKSDGVIGSEVRKYAYEQAAGGGRISRRCSSNSSRLALDANVK